MRLGERAEGRLVELPGHREAVGGLKRLDHRGAELLVAALVGVGIAKAEAKTKIRKKFNLRPRGRRQWWNLRRA